MRTLTLKVPERLDGELERETQRRRMTKSALIRAALEAFLAPAGGADDSSFASRAADLAGSLEGPADLSCAEKHLEGYGE